MKTTMLNVEIGQIFMTSEGVYLMKTDMNETGLLHGTDYFTCVSKGGKIYPISIDVLVEVDISWREQVDGYKVLYNCIKNLFPIKPQEVYDNEKGKEL